jgi:hypothetical protein
VGQATVVSRRADRPKKPRKKLPRRRTPSPLLNDSGEHTIPKPLPERLLADFLIKRSKHDERDVREYVESQVTSEKVTHLEKIKTEHLRTRALDAWDVRTTRGRYWVITNPANLYSQKLFPSLDFTISFHIGVIERVFARQAPPVPEEQQRRLSQAWRRWTQAAEALDHANEAEDFQAVGMRCRECLLDFIAATAKDEMVPAGQETPKRGDFLQWSVLIANVVAHGSSAERVRHYLRGIAESAWPLVNWLTHTRSAVLADGVLAVEATQHVLAAFGAAIIRHERGVPERCPRCSSYRLSSDYRADRAVDVTLCESCGWTDEKDPLIDLFKSPPP